jgi:hypothetical protein
VRTSSHASSFVLLRSPVIKFTARTDHNVSLFLWLSFTLPCLKGSLTIIGIFTCFIYTFFLSFLPNTTATKVSHLSSITHHRVLKYALSVSIPYCVSGLVNNLYNFEFVLLDIILSKYHSISDTPQFTKPSTYVHSHDHNTIGKSGDHSMQCPCVLIDVVFGPLFLFLLV